MDLLRIKNCPTATIGVLREILELIYINLIKAFLLSIFIFKTCILLHSILSNSTRQYFSSLMFLGKDTFCVFS